MSSLPALARQQIEAVGRAFLARRPLVVGPLAAWTLVVLARAGVPPLQLRVVTMGMLLGFALFVTEAVVARRRAITSAWLFGSLLLTLLGVSAVTLVLGGLGGPFLPMLFAPAGVGFAAFGVSARGVALWALLSLALLVMLTVGAPFPALEPGAHRLVALGAASASVLLLLLGVGGLSGAYLRAGELAVRASDAVVAAAHERARAIEELNGHFAHELKNPLAALKALVEVMREGGDEDRQRRRLEVAAGEVGRMEQVISHGLDFTRPLAPARREAVELGALVGAVVEVLGAQAERRGVALRVEGAELQVALEPARLKEALMNLLLNALEASPRGSSVSVSWRVDGARVVLEVRDAGQGLSAEVLARAGEPFFTTRPDGSGLGVALARQVAVQHGGDLVLRNDGGCVAALSLARS